VVLTVLGAITVLLRLAAVARGNLDLAFALVHVSNFGEILLSTGLIMAPALTVFVALAWEFQTLRVIKTAIKNPNRDTLLRSLWWCFGLCFTLVIARIFQTQAGTLVLVVAVVLVFLFSTLLLKFGARLVRKIQTELDDAVKGRTHAVGVIGLILISLGGLVLVFLCSASALRLLIPSDQAWAYTEVVSFADQEPYVARVISSDSEWTYLVIDDPRSLEIVPTTQIVSRSVCSLDDSVETINDRLWGANTFGSVALSMTLCSEELANSQEAYVLSLQD